MLGSSLGLLFVLLLVGALVAWNLWAWGTTPGGRVTVVYNGQVVSSLP